MIEIPPKFAGRPPVHPDAKNPLAVWKGAAGLAEDVRRYGKWMRDEAFKRIGHLYPPVEVTKAMAKARPDLEQYVGDKLTVIAWLWARTVKSPNPAYSRVDVPLVSTFILSSREGKEAYVQPVIHKDGYTFTVRVGKPPAAARGGTKTARGSNFRCLMSSAPIGADYVMKSGMEHGLGIRLMAVVVEGNRERPYLSPIENVPNLTAMPDIAFLQQPMTNDRRWFSPPLYGFPNWADIFTRRQLVALTTFSDLVGEAREKVKQDAMKAGMLDDNCGLEDGGTGATAYAEAASLYLAFCVDKMTDTNTTVCSWQLDPPRLRATFGRQAIPMVWDPAEANIFADAAGDFGRCVLSLVEVLECLGLPGIGRANQQDATALVTGTLRVFSTDPPYYDNIGYADLSDFFYVWLRRALKPIYPALFATVAVPKAEELVATPHRHGGKEKAESFFLAGMAQAMTRLAEQTHPAFPVTIYYAFKQSESESEKGTASTGWETFLNAVIRAGLGINGTWPIRSELATRNVGRDTNALASSIILVCRPRAVDAGTISRRQFVRQLNETLPLALDAMTRASEGLHSPVAPVDLSQAIIGPGMAIFSRYDAVLEADGTPMTVKTALQLINRFLAEDDFDADTQFCLHWFEQHGWEVGKFGEATVLARSKGTSVEGVKATGVIEAGGGNVRLFKWKEYPADWHPRTDVRLPVWEALHQLIRAYNTHGDSGAARVLAGTAGKAEAARQLAYRLYTLCERANRAEDARAYNEVVTGWTGIESAAAKVPAPKQRTLFDHEGAE
ncbi:MAG TPA: hypothetical protein DDY78_08025 [Planctomycetales bacterium]|nr:hypothetical protein [Planctomycetales bacterium]